MGLGLKIKITSAVSSLLLLPSCAFISSCSHAPLESEYHIININDFHGAVPGYGETDSVIDAKSSTPGALRVNRDVQNIIKQYPGSIFLSSGDENSGENFSTCLKGDTTYSVLKSMGVRYAAVGNHAFEWGLDPLATGHYDEIARTDQTKGQYFINSNILNVNTYQDKQWCIDPSKPEFKSDYAIWKNQRISWADPYKLVNLGDHTICLIGLTTKKTLIDGNQKITSQLSFIDYNAAVNYTKFLLKEQIGEKLFNQIESFMLLTHIDCGMMEDPTVPGREIPQGEAVDLARTITTPIDAIFAAHSHKLFDQIVHNNIIDKNIFIGQAGSSGEAFLDTTIKFNDVKQKGSRLSFLSMDIKYPSIAKGDIRDLDPVKDKKEINRRNLLAAQNEWKNLIDNPVDDQSKKVSQVYTEQKTKVISILGKVLSKIPAKPTDENGNEIDYYTNSIIDSGVAIGHQYYMSPRIIEYMGGWYNRAMMLGFYHMHKQEIEQTQFPKLPMPSISFCSQDSIPNQLKKGDVTLADAFKIYPYDNRSIVGYLYLEQLAAIINYFLAGTPSQGKGFDYSNNHLYEVDLRKFDGKKICDDPFDPNSNYLCGPLSWYGMKVNLVKISESERSLYDSTAKYRVKMVEYTTKQGLVTKIPDIHVYDPYFEDENGNAICDIDDPSTWPGPGHWYELQNAEAHKRRFISFVLPSFSYDGGNKQNKMFQAYAKTIYRHEILEPWVQTELEFKSFDSIQQTLIEFIENADNVTSWGKRFHDKPIDLNISDKIIKQFVNIEE